MQSKDKDNNNTIRAAAAAATTTTTITATTSADCEFLCHRSGNAQIFPKCSTSKLSAPEE
jgi:hypothetical protein